MKLSRAAIAALCLTAGFLLGGGGYFAGRVTRPEPYRITTAHIAEEPPAAGKPLPTEKINVNTADAAQLQLLPGVGPSRADAIIAEREAGGPFASPEDLLRVPGIGKATLARLRDYIITSEGANP